MFEKLDLKTGGNVEPAEQNRLSRQAWETNVVADGSVAQGSSKVGAKEVAKVTPVKKPDAFKEHVKINDRCALDIYEHHWELTMPKVSIPYSKGGVILNKQGKLELVVNGGKETVTSEKLTMDDTGIWTMKDDKGNSVQMIDQGMHQYGVDVNHPEQKTEFKQKQFDNGAVVLIDKSDEMTLIRDQDHNFTSKEGTPQYEKEQVDNRLIVGFNKKTGVSSVSDQGKTWAIKTR